MRALQIAALALLAPAITGCASDYQHRDASIGAGAGAVLGAVIGKQLSGADGSPYVGAAIGALAGAAVGNYMDKQRLELQQKLAEEARRNELVITQIAQDTLKIGLASDVSFDLNSAQLRPQALNTYAKIAATLKSYNQTVIHVVGHTDTTGSAALNRSLSDRRAASVGSYLSLQGLPAERIREEGRGEREPLVPSGDQVDEPRNRRVDIVIKAVVQGNEAAAWTPPPYLGG